MTLKERFDAAMQVARFSADRWDQRRSYEWKLSLGVWAILVAAIATFRVPRISHWYGLIAIMIYIYWAANIWFANYVDRQLMRSYRVQSSTMLESQGVHPPPVYRRAVYDWFEKWPKLNRFVGFTVDYSWIFQVAVTILLLVLVYAHCQTKPHWPFRGRATPWEIG